MKSFELNKKEESLQIKDNSTNLYLYLPVSTTTTK
jgi:hypothetical protein